VTQFYYDVDLFSKLRFIVASIKISDSENNAGFAVQRSYVTLLSVTGPMMIIMIYPNI
jgi:hypothetical protein